MIVVTGAGRTGTSLVMRLLRALDVQIIGEKFPSHAGPESFNPEGYWECEEDVWAGLNLRKDLSGVGIKLWPAYLERIEPSQISRIIVCVRQKVPAVESLVRLICAIKPERGVYNAKELMSVRFDVSYSDIGRYLYLHSIPCITILNEELIRSPIPRLDRLCKFVGGKESLIPEALSLIHRPLTNQPLQPTK